MRITMHGNPNNPLAVEAAKRLVLVFNAIIREREHQTDKYGVVFEPTFSLEGGEKTIDGWLASGPGGHELPGWLLVIRKELREAEEAATGHGKRTKTGRNTVRAELLQIAAVCVAALEQHGVEAVAPTDGRVASPEEYATRSHGAATTPQPADKSAREALERVLAFLSVIEKVNPHLYMGEHGHILNTTGAATPLYVEDLRLLCAARSHGATTTPQPADKSARQQAARIAEREMANEVWREFYERRSGMSADEEKQEFLILVAAALARRSHGAATVKKDGT